MRGILRICTLAAIVACTAIGLLQDHRADAAGPEALLGPLRADATAESICEALDRAGPNGLRWGVGLLDDPEPRARAGAAAYLGRRRSRVAVPHLIRLLRDPDASVRAAAANALGTIADPRALPFLERAMADSHADAADAALRAARAIRQRPDSPTEG